MSSQPWPLWFPWQPEPWGCPSEASGFSAKPAALGRDLLLPQRPRMWAPPQAAASAPPRCPEPWGTPSACTVDACYLLATVASINTSGAARGGLGPVSEPLRSSDLRSPLFHLLGAPEPKFSPVTQTGRVGPAPAAGWEPLAAEGGLLRPSLSARLQGGRCQAWAP